MAPLILEMGIKREVTDVDFNLCKCEKYISAGQRFVLYEIFSPKTIRM